MPRKSKEAHAEYQREVWYPNNREGVYANNRRRKENTLQEFRELKMAIGCADCGFNSHYAALDFDHLPGFDKSFDVAAGISRGLGRNKLYAEVAKCEVVCSNCHRIRTHDRFSGKARGAPRMAKILTPQFVSVVLPVLVSLAEAAAARTETKVDDKLVEALKNPLIMAFLVAMLSGDQPVPQTEDEKIVEEHGAAVRSLYACAESLLAA